MRKIMLLLLPVSLGMGGSTDSAQHHVQSTLKIEVEEFTKIVEKEKFEVPEYTLDVKPLIQAMIMVESEGNDSAYCKKEEAVGCLQIRPIMVREVNRILDIQKSELDKYTLEDRWSREKSIEMFHIVNGYHNKNSTYEEIARAWNGGPNWFKKGLTKRYWKRVQKQLKKQKKNEHSNTEFTKV